jgi:GAF domain-containing protein
MEDKVALYEGILQRIESIVAGGLSRDAKLQQICELLESQVAYFDWVGFYITDPENPRQLVLGPYVGAPTEHVRIEFGQGICGRAADSRRMFVVQDVSEETNYLACSPDVKAEIVLPIFLSGNIWGELDIDSHTTAPFSSEDGDYLGRICGVVAGFVGAA